MHPKADTSRCQKPNPDDAWLVVVAQGGPPQTNCAKCGMWMAADDRSWARHGAKVGLHYHPSCRCEPPPVNPRIRNCQALRILGKVLASLGSFDVLWTVVSACMRLSCDILMRVRLCTETCRGLRWTRSAHIPALSAAHFPLPCNRPSHPGHDPASNPSWTLRRALTADWWACLVA